MSGAKRLHTQEYRRIVGALAEWLAALGYASSTVYYAPRHAAEFLAWLEAGGITDRRRITGATVEGYLGYLSERPNRVRGGGLSRAYLAKHRQALRLLARYLWESGQGGFDVPPEIRRGGPSEAAPEVLTRSEVEALYAACGDDALGIRDRATLAVYYGCGLRRSEGLGLDVADVLLERDLVYVRRGKNYRERYVPLAWGVRRDLAAWLYEARPLMADPEERAVLVSVRGSRIGGQSLLNRLHRLQGEVPGLRRRRGSSGRSIGLHTLRHSVATHLLQGGMDLGEIAAFLGHASLESTQRYTHLLDTLKRRDGRDAER
ncbi:MAG: tyrosine-type recombinase/integrase [Bacteroidota bacterium]